MPLNDILLFCTNCKQNEEKISQTKNDSKKCHAIMSRSYTIRLHNSQRQQRFLFEIERNAEREKKRKICRRLFARNWRTTCVQMVRIMRRRTHAYFDSLHHSNTVYFRFAFAHISRFDSPGRFDRIICLS